MKKGCHKIIFATAFLRREEISYILNDGLFFPFARLPANEHGYGPDTFVKGKGDVGTDYQEV